MNPAYLRKYFTSLTTQAHHPLTYQPDPSLNNPAAPLEQLIAIWMAQDKEALKLKAKACSNYSRIMYDFAHPAPHDHAAQLRIKRHITRGLPDSPAPTATEIKDFFDALKFPELPSQPEPTEQTEWQDLTPEQAKDIDPALTEFLAQYSNKDHHPELTQAYKLAMPVAEMLYGDHEPDKRQRQAVYFQAAMSHIKKEVGHN